VLLFEDWSQFLGINTRQDLARVLHVYKQRLLERIMERPLLWTLRAPMWVKRKGGKRYNYPSNTTLLGSTEIGEIV